jgi:lycopene cyclase domain-containing protein
VTYTVAALLGVVGALVADLAILRTRLVTRQVFWLTYPIVLVGQLLSNGVLTGARVVTYRPDAIVGWRIAYAPVEDLGFGFSLVLVTLSVWVWLGRRGLDRAPLAGGPHRQRRRRGL